MIDFTTESQGIEFIMDACRQDEPRRGDLASYASKCRCYYEGLQWIQSRNRGGGTAFEREFTNWNGDRGPLRVTTNRIARNIIGVMASTNPERLEVDATVPDHAVDLRDADIADLMEAAASGLIDSSGLLATARAANKGRCIASMHGIGLSIEKVRIEIERRGAAAEAVNWYIRSFDFDASRLVLDPGVTAMNLRHHDFVIYEDVYTIHKARRVFGDEALADIKESDLSTVGQLLPVEMEFNALSSGRLYSRYAAHSKTKAIKVHQVHLRDASGRFSRMPVFIEGGGRDRMKWVNADDDRSPFGHDGLPLVRLTGYHRDASSTPVSDVAMMIDDQDKLNLLETLKYQSIQNYVNANIVVDAGWLSPKGLTYHEASDALNNRIWLGDSQNKRYQPPSYIKGPEPSSVLHELGRQAEESVREQGFRGEAHEGKTKCISGMALVEMSDGRRVRMSDVVPGDRVLCVDDDGKISSGTVEWHVDSGTKDALRIIAERGASVTASHDHRILTFDGWRVAGDLLVGDWIASPKVLPSQNGPRVPIEDAILLAAWIAEGDKSRKDAYAITNGNPEIRSAIIGCARACGWGVREDRGLRIRLLKNGTEFGPNDMLRFYGARQMTTDDVRVPDAIMASGKDVVREFLRTIYGCDGGAFGAVIGYCSNSRALVDDIRSLLLRFGIRARVQPSGRAWAMFIGDAVGIRRFSDEIGILGKSDRLSSLVESTRDNGPSCNFRVPGSVKSMMKHGATWHRNRHGVSYHRNDVSTGLSESNAVIIAEIEDNDRIRSIIDTDIEWVRVRRIESVPSVHTYDMEVSEHHNFIADNIVVHNSHVTRGNFERAIELSELPLDDRVSDDLLEYGTIISVLVGTGANALRNGSPAVASILVKQGFGAEELGMFAQIDASDLPCTLVVREEAVRRRSRSQRRQDLVDAASLGAFGGDISAVRRSLASDLDMPVSDLDKSATVFGREAARRVMRGEEYQPYPLMGYSSFVIDELTRAMMGREASRIEGARERLGEAIVAQRQFDLVVEMSLAAQAQGGQEPRQMAPTEASPEELLASLDPQALLPQAQ